MIAATLLLLLTAALSLPCLLAFSTPLAQPRDPFEHQRSVPATRAEQSTSRSQFSSPKKKIEAFELVRSLVVDHQCYTSESGVQRFAERCSSNVIYEDLAERKEPYLGKDAVVQHMLDKVKARRKRGELRVDSITDGKCACGFAWTYTCGNLEGLRGTTFTELDKDGQILFIREIAEPIYKPGDSMVGLLRLISGEKEPRRAIPYKQQTPTTASDIGRYLFCDVQWSDMDECKRFLDENIFCRDFNYAKEVIGREAVGKFAEAFGNLPGIVFRGQRFDDGVLSTCYVWEVDLKGAPEPVKGISFQELNPETKKISYMRDLSAPAIMPPLLGKLARLLRPGLGVFRGVETGSRPGGR